MINTQVINTAKDLKNKMDAAYTVFKKNPTIENSTTWTNTVRIFNSYCVKAITDLIEDKPSNKEDIIKNFDKYSKCKCCNTELLYIADKDRDNYVASLEFMENFPGWCYSCLVEHCLKTDCNNCTIANPSNVNCSFLEIKNLHTQGK